MRPVSRADLARIAGVSRMAITKQCKGSLAPACVEDRVDLDHPAVKAFIARHDRSDAVPPAVPKPVPAKPARPTKVRKPTKKAAKRQPPTRPETAQTKPPPERKRPRAPALDESGYSDELAEFTLEQIVNRWGTVRAYKDILEAHEKRERARKNRLDNEQTERTLVPREPITAFVFGTIDATQKRILTDAAKTVVRRLYALHNNGGSEEQGETLFRELMSAQLAPVRATALRVLRHGKP
jgi:hypothetical protein